MPPVVIAGGLAAAATVGSAAMQSHSAGNSQEQALAFAREQEAARQKNWQQEYADYKANVANWNALRNTLAQHLGIQLPEMTGGGVPTSGGGGTTGVRTAAGLGGFLQQVADAKQKLGLADANVPPDAAQEYQGPDYLPPLAGDGRRATVADLLNMARA